MSQKKDIIKLEIKGKTTLGNLPLGSLFLSDDYKALGLKTEYRTEFGAIEAYIVGSGEFFWGGTSTPEAQAKITVYKVKIK